jgi:hypothetical protein
MAGNAPLVTDSACNIVRGGAERARLWRAKEGLRGLKLIEFGSYRGRAARGTHLGTPQETTTVTGARHATTTSSVQPSVATGAHGGGPPVTRWG